MSFSERAEAGSAAPPPDPTPQLRKPLPHPHPLGQAFAWVCTNNPFYVVSAALFLVGVHQSLDPAAEDGQPYLLLAGLSGYTLLLAITGWALVRFGRVWDDARTVLLVLVLMFLATSVTFDAMLVHRPAAGIFFYLFGLAFAAATSESVIRGIRLQFPWGFRGPYYLILAMFFLYPTLLVPFLHEPFGVAMLGGLTLFPAAMGVAFLTLIPAVRRAVREGVDSGGPWRWPWYPGSLFVFLALGVVARGYLLCVSYHQVTLAYGDATIFQPFFLVPFVLMLGAVLFEGTLAGKQRLLGGLLFVIPVTTFLMSLTGPVHRLSAAYDVQFREWVVVDPAFLTTLAVAAFYLYVAVRGVWLGLHGATVAFVVLTFMCDRYWHEIRNTGLQTLPLLAGAICQFAAARASRSYGPAIAGGLLLAFAGISWVGSGASGLVPWVVLASVATYGAVTPGIAGQAVRAIAAMLAVVLGLQTTLGLPGDAPAHVASLRVAQSLTLASLAVAYAYFLRDKPAVAAALVIALANAWWCSANGYDWLKARVPGLGLLLGSAAAFTVAVAVSVAKTPRVNAWLRRRLRRPASEET